MSNVFSFTGALGRDSELKKMTSGDSVLSFTVANNVGYGDKKQTLWISCSVFGKRADTLHHHLTKGKQVFVSGELKTREYTGKDGLNKVALEMNPNVVDFVGGKQESNDYAQKQPESASAGNDYPFSDDIPF